MLKDTLLRRTGESGFLGDRMLKSCRPTRIAALAAVQLVQHHHQHRHRHDVRHDHRHDHHHDQNHQTSAALQIFVR